ncbi:Alpha-SNAP protein [Dioscorea alata]|uniref:Alpha-SNAP protein n=1 Tax=Dioscorea alata TaxID=55571 RepID=A0ACB7W0R8_DIOAL|nr:Alpha-SNAP protein [Dioscorea alata]
MDFHANYAPLMPARRARQSRPPAPAVRWFREWVPQEIAATGGKCLLLKWVTEDMMKVLKESEETETKEAEPDPTTEVLFLCSHEGCGKTFIDVGALRKHAHIHGERQHICPYEGCGRKFLDSSKLKRHILIHTGAKDYVCPYEGCGKAFSLDFNLRTHMKTHLPENYHVCPHKDCGKRYTQEHKLNAHLKTFHEKNTVTEFTKHAPVEKLHYNPKPASIVYTPAPPDRPYACPYEGCGKAYIHEYKLNLHLKREHPGHNSEENRKQVSTMTRAIDDASDPDAHVVKGGSSKKSISKISNRKSLTLDSRNLDIAKKPWTETKVEEDSEETEEDRDNVEDTIWRYRENEEDEETEDED